MANFPEHFYAGHICLYFYSHKKTPNTLGYLEFFQFDGKGVDRFPKEADLCHFF